MTHVVLNHLIACGVAWIGLGLAGSFYFTLVNPAAAWIGAVPVLTNSRVENGLSVVKAAGE